MSMPQWSKFTIQNASCQQILRLFAVFLLETLSAYSKNIDDVVHSKLYELLPTLLDLSKQTTYFNKYCRVNKPLFGQQ